MNVEPDGFVDGELDCTRAGSRFVEQHGLDLISFTADRINENLLVQLQRNVLLALDPDRKLDASHSFVNHPQIRLNRELGDRVRGELMLTRYVDNYLTYLSELLREIFVARPEVLRSSEQVSIQEIMQFTSVADLIAYLADRKITQLSFSGLGDVMVFFDKRLGLELLLERSLLDRMREWVALRNLFVHRRGMVDQRALDAGLSGAFAVGERASFSRTDGVAAMKGIFAAMKSLDERAARKFGLPRVQVAALPAEYRSITGVEGAGT